MINLTTIGDAVVTAINDRQVAGDFAAVEDFTAARSYDLLELEKDLTSALRVRVYIPRIDNVRTLNRRGDQSGDHLIQIGIVKLLDAPDEAGDPDSVIDPTLVDPWVNFAQRVAETTWPNVSDANGRAQVVNSPLSTAWDDDKLRELHVYLAAISVTYRALPV